MLKDCPKDRKRLFSGLKEIAKKCKFMGMKDGLCEKVKKTCKRGEKGKSGKRSKYDEREKVAGLKSLPNSYISSKSE